jgi:zinc-binding alcohol dehydrogenase family protein
MKAIAIVEKLPLDDPKCFVELELPKPAPGPRDLLVRVKAVSVNPVDYKVRQRRSAAAREPQILGWDAAGIVETIGSEVSIFKPGDEVFYAGDITRPGSNAEFQVVDERIVARKPRTLSFAEAAALPLTTITAWEALFDRLNIAGEKKPEHRERSVLIIGGAGGVGSIAIQIAKRVAGLTVIATASRKESIEWCRLLGADHVIDHRQPLLAQLKTLGVGELDYILCFNDTDRHWAGMAEAIKPQGRICSIVENENPLNLGLLKNKSAGFIWEFMFTRSKFQTPDMIEQHHLLTRVAELVEHKILRTTNTETVGQLTAENLSRVHQRLESGRTIGKLTLIVS